MMLHTSSNPIYHPVGMPVCVFAYQVLRCVCVRVCVSGFHLQWQQTPLCDTLSHWSRLNSQTETLHARTDTHTHVSCCAHEGDCHHITGVASDLHTHTQRHTYRHTLPSALSQYHHFSLSSFPPFPLISLRCLHRSFPPFSLHLSPQRSRAQWLDCL